MYKKVPSTGYAESFVILLECLIILFELLSTRKIQIQNVAGEFTTHHDNTAGV